MIGPAKDVIDRLGADCGGDGSFYVCDEKPSKFIGCCTIDPCKTSDGLCHDDYLRNTTFNEGSYNLLKAQDCISDAPEVQWWTCAAVDPPFMGCCSDNPCALNGCPADSLFAAKLSENQKNALVFLPDGTKVDDGGLSTGATAGIAVGATLGGLAIIGAIFFFLWRRRKANKAQQQPQMQTPGSQQVTPATDAATLHYQGQSPGGYHHDKIASPYASTYAPSVNPHYDPLQQNAPTPSPQMSQAPWRGTVYSGGSQSPGQHQQHPYGYVPSVSSQGDLYGNAHGSHHEAWHQQQQQQMVQELPTQQQIVELPEETSYSKGDDHRRN